MPLKLLPDYFYYVSASDTSFSKKLRGNFFRHSLNIPI